MTRTLARALASGGLLLVLTFALAAGSSSSTATTGPSTGPATAPTPAPASVAPPSTPAVSEAPPAGAAAAAGCLAGTAPATVAPSIPDFAFPPPTVTVTPADLLGRKHDDRPAHTPTLDDGACDTGRSGWVGRRQGRSSSADAAGKTFSYHCAIHPRMTATIVVSP